MDSLSETKTIRTLHKKDLGDARKNLCYFLSGWLGGAKLYQQHFGSISIPGFHKKFNIGTDEKNAWLFCMERPFQNRIIVTNSKPIYCTNYLFPQNVAAFVIDSHCILNRLQYIFCICIVDGDALSLIVD